MSKVYLCFISDRSNEDVVVRTREVDARTLMLDLVSMRLRTTSWLLQTTVDSLSDSKPVLGMCQTEWASEVMLGKAEVMVCCGEKQTTHVTTARHLMHVRPDKFSVTLVGKTMENQPTGDNSTVHPVQLTNYTYSCSFDSK